MTSQDAVSIINAFDAKWNAHDEEAILDCFTDDVVIRLSPPPPPPLREVSTGKQQARDFVRVLLPGFHVNSKDHKVVGDTVTWQATVSADGFRQMGADPATATCEAILQGGKIKSFNPTFSSETVSKMRAAMGGGQG